MNKLIDRLDKAFQLTDDLVNGLSSTDLSLTLSNLPSNTIGEQVWCIVGARESYLQAIIHDHWIGFSCSLTDVSNHKNVMNSIQTSSLSLMEYIQSTDLTEIQTDFLFTLLEHEVMHHGQLIRYMYGNKLTFPESWTERYTV